MHIYSILLYDITERKTFESVSNWVKTIRDEADKKVVIVLAANKSDLDLMEDALYDFIFEDISHILVVGEYDFACDLLIRIEALLNDEVISTYDSWYNLVDRFMEHVNTLEFSIYLDAERLNDLYANMNHIMNRWP